MQSSEFPGHPAIRAANSSSAGSSWAEPQKGRSASGWATSTRRWSSTAGTWGATIWRKDAVLRRWRISVADPGAPALGRSGQDEKRRSLLTPPSVCDGWRNGLAPVVVMLDANSPSSEP